ncbi:MAG: hypothetical protein ACM3XS_04450 [Bacteroidota bacterium]
MDLVFLVVLAVLSLLGSLVKKLGESSARPSLPSPPPRPSWQPPEMAPEEGESSEDGPWSAEEEGLNGTEEGGGLEGEEDRAGGYLPEILREQEEIRREKEEFRAASTHLTGDEETQLVPAASAAAGDEFTLAWDDDEAAGETAAPGVTAATPAGLAADRAALARAVIAAEILGPRGGWRPRSAVRR